jgi:tetratricopeptide (TPR) repeat protein
LAGGSVSGSIESQSNDDFPFSAHARVRYARRMRFPALLASLCLFSAAAFAQHDGHNMADMQQVPPPEQLPVPVKMTGIGNSHITIKANPEAQAWFDQGLSLHHDFWDYEAAKAFEQGIRVDPKCAMCWWGVAMEETFRSRGNNAYAKHALEEAVKLKDQASDTDKLYIEAAQAAQEDDENHTHKEAEILRKLVSDHPHDTQARVFLAESLCDGFDDAGEPKAGQKECIAILEGVIQDAPSDSAAHHYWIHAIEPSDHPERAIKSAELLASLAPTSGHMVHMPGHIYFRVGDYATAQHWFAASTETDERYMREQHVDIDNDWNYVHNLMYSIANLMEQGKLAEANALSDKAGAVRGRLEASLYIWSVRDSMTRVSYRLPVAMRLGDWDAVLTMVSQVKLEGEKTRNLQFLTGELEAYARGMRALDRNDAEGAKAASDRMDAGLWRLHQRVADEDAAKKAEKKDEKKNDKKDEPLTAEVMPDALPDPLLKALSIQSLELRAGILAAQNKLDDAKKVYATAQAEEKRLGYHEPPMYIRPVGETEAATLLKVKDYDGAEAAYKQALEARPNSGFGLYGLARVRELQGDTAGARAAYAAFLKAWNNADSTLPEVAHARQLTAGMSVAAR